MNYPEIIPPFNKSIQYKELNPKVGGYTYRFKTLQDIEIFFIHPFISRGNVISFSDKNDKIWLKITPYSIIISKDYAWDGCTPKRWWGIWWGSPDFEDTRLASLVHDALLQFHKTKHFPISRNEIDYIFKIILEKNDFILSELYYSGVKFGTKHPSKTDNSLKSTLTIPPKC